MFTVPLATEDWQAKGIWSTGTAGLNGEDFSLISSAVIPRTYDVSMTLKLARSGGTYDLYLGASSDASQYYALEIAEPVLEGVGCTAQASLIESQAGGRFVLATAHVPCRDGISYHAVLRANHELLVYTDGKPLLSAYATLALTGQPGVGGRNIPSENGIVDMRVTPLVPKIPHFDRPHTIEISAPANSAHFRWPEANNADIGWYVIRRDGQVLGRSAVAEWTDMGLSPNTTYTYSIQAFSLQGQPGVALSFQLTTAMSSAPPVPALPPRKQLSNPTPKLLCPDCDPGDPGDPGDPPPPPPPPGPVETTTFHCSTALRYRPVVPGNPILGLVNHAYLYQTFWSYSTWSAIYPPSTSSLYTIVEGLPEFNPPQLNLQGMPWGYLMANIDSNAYDPVFNDPLDNVGTDPQLGIYWENNVNYGCPVYYGIENQAVSDTATYIYNPTPPGPTQLGENSNWFANDVLVNGHIDGWPGPIYLGTPPNAPGFPGSIVWPSIIATYPVY